MTWNIKNLSNNLPLKMLACVIGYSLWVVLSSQQSVECTYNIPLCFYNLSEHVQIEAPETLSVTLTGSRSLLKHINQERLVIHIDASDLQNGAQALEITNKTLFLPEAIKLIHYQPLPLVINCQKSS